MDKYFVVDAKALPQYIDWIYEQVKKTKPEIVKRTFREYLNLYYMSSYRLCCFILCVDDDTNDPKDAYACSINTDELAQFRVNVVHVGVEVTEDEISKLHDMNVIMSLASITISEKFKTACTGVCTPFPYSALWENILNSTTSSY